MLRLMILDQMLTFLTFSTLVLKTFRFLTSFLIAIYPLLRLIFMNLGTQCLAVVLLASAAKTDQATAQLAFGIIYSYYLLIYLPCRNTTYILFLIIPEMLLLFFTVAKIDLH